MGASSASRTSALVLTPPDSLCRSASTTCGPALVSRHPLARVAEPCRPAARIPGGFQPKCVCLAQGRQDPHKRRTIAGGSPSTLTGDPMEPSTLHRPTSRPSARRCTSRSRASASPASRRSSASGRRARSSSGPGWSASSTSARSRRARTCRASRRSSTTRSARSSSASRRSAPRTLAQQHRRARPRPPGRAARRGHDRGALPRAQAGAGLRHRDAGALHAVRHRGRAASAARAASSASPPRA